MRGARRTRRLLAGMGSLLLVVSMTVAVPRGDAASLSLIAVSTTAKSMADPSTSSNNRRNPHPGSTLVRAPPSAHRTTNRRPRTTHQATARPREDSPDDQPIPTSAPAHRMHRIPQSTQKREHLSPRTHRHFHQPPRRRAAGCRQASNGYLRRPVRRFSRLRSWCDVGPRHRTGVPRNVPRHESE